jgi:putative hydrolase of the HAD superfamily
MEPVQVEMVRSTEARSADLLQFRDSLKKRKWFGFDLDDTLHEFRKASGSAVKQILDLVSARNGINLRDLETTYAIILAQKTSSAFVEGKTSHEYRQERFVALLEHFSIPANDEFLSELLVNYEATLTRNLQLKSGALHLLKLLKLQNKKIVVITEGPEDAQQRTVEALGIAGYIDFLATTNSFGVSKTSGLFGKVLKHLDIGAEDLVYFGDNEQRDVVPALQEGIFCVHYAEKALLSLEDNPAKINTWKILESILTLEDST